MAAIGVFDSGIGGLTVVSALRRLMPAESILYLGDTARLPYGTKSPETVRRYTARNVAFLCEREVKAVVVACNTASALALADFRAPVPVYGVIEPGAALAARRSVGRVGVIATESTVRSGAYARALAECRPDLEIHSQACPLFVPLVEEGWHDDPITEAIARRYLQPLLQKQVDTLVLGCTHYPLLAPLLARISGPEVQLVDSARSVAQAVAQDLRSAGLALGQARSLEDGEEAGGSLHLCVTDAGERFLPMASRFLGLDVEADQGMRSSLPSLELVEV